MPSLTVFTADAQAPPLTPAMWSTLSNNPSSLSACSCPRAATYAREPPPEKATPVRVRDAPLGGVASAPCEGTIKQRASKPKAAALDMVCGF